MLCDEVRPQTSTKQALNRLPREVTLDIDTLAFHWQRRPVAGGGVGLASRFDRWRPARFNYSLEIVE
jgi:hypothetical protein